VSNITWISIAILGADSQCPNQIKRQPTSSTRFAGSSAKRLSESDRQQFVAWQQKMSAYIEQRGLENALVEFNKIGNQ
jgi:lipase chaperone LimK